jgi:hypothetical protein
MIATTIAATAEHCAARLEASHNPMTGAQALRAFAAAIRENDTDHELQNDSVH